MIVIGILLVVLLIFLGLVSWMLGICWWMSLKKLGEVIGSVIFLLVDVIFVVGVGGVFGGVLVVFGIGNVLVEVLEIIYLLLMFVVFLLLLVFRVL